LCGFYFIVFFVENKIFFTLFLHTLKIKTASLLILMIKDKLKNASL